MHCFSRYLPPTVMAIGVAASIGARADDEASVNRFRMTNLVSDLKGAANFQDPILQNSGGVAFTPAGSPFWITDNVTGCSTLYDGTGVKQGLQVKIPLPGNVIPATACMTVNPNNPPNPPPAAPTGLVWNPTTNPMTAFLVP